MDADAVAKRLTEEAWSRRLAELSVETLFATPLKTLAPEDKVVALVKEGLRGWLDEESALSNLERIVKEISAELTAQTDKLEDILPEQLREGAEAWLARPWSPDRAVVLAALDRAPVRALIRKLLLDAILEFGRGMGGGTAGSVAKGIGGLAKFAAERAGTIGALVGAVGGEVNRQLESRASDFADAALSGIIQKIADEFSSPARAKQQAELRVAIFEGVLALRGSQLAKELQRADIVGGTRITRDALFNWLETPESNAQLERAVKRILSHESNRPLGEVLKELGLYDVARKHGVDALAERIRQIAATDSFRDFARDLLRD